MEGCSLKRSRINDNDQAASLQEKMLFIPRLMSMKR